jgi:hypothetical protein
MIPRQYLVRIAPWWVLILIIGSFLPGAGKDALGTTNPPAAEAQGRVGSQHRLVHFAAFGSTGLLFMLIARTRKQRLLAALSVACLGLAIEYAQFEFACLRSMEWWDFRDDTLAAFGSLVLVQWNGLRRTFVSSRVRICESEIGCKQERDR